MSNHCSDWVCTSTASSRQTLFPMNHNESQLPRPSSTAQPYTPCSSFTHQVVQTRNVKPRGSRTSWHQNSRPSYEHKCRTLFTLVP